jgi:hypothetical protein
MTVLRDIDTDIEPTALLKRRRRFLVRQSRSLMFRRNRCGSRTQCHLVEAHLVAWHVAAFMAYGI